MYKIIVPILKEGEKNSWNVFPFPLTPSKKPQSCHIGSMGIQQLQFSSLKPEKDTTSI